MHIFFKFFFVCRLKICPIPFKQFFIGFIGFLSSAEFTGRICMDIFIACHLQTFCLFLFLICQICNLRLLSVDHRLPGLLFNSSHTSCLSSSFATYPCSFSSSCCLLDSFSPESCPYRLVSFASSACIASISS